MNIHWIQHVPFEGLGNIKEWASTNNHSLSCTQQFNNDTLPKLNEFDLLIVMGGPMGVYDTKDYHWLTEELTLIKSAIEADKAVLGICLGSQLIAASLGAHVYPGDTKEIGWFQIQTNHHHSPLCFENTSPTVFHWHGDTFDLPQDARLLASTPEVVNQAFMIRNKTVALQFHLEQTPETIQEMVNNGAHELMEEGLKIQSAEEITHQKKYFDANKKVMFGLLDYLARNQ
ncbi:type 1 glutamine amidotransferase [Saccharicrinis fermentans]|uniref:Glutamine amidotransferase n=1 Tax=Saccharicrinis fermentans DSM 9555 = JCM 21142 TaxID=869213 RepID=W7Y9U7_9BACT|nr:gamma-glutamyl-gamma-aminobutyrate hydrolase family protein [Saccharicrinis fermentans]GAF05092.1 glutamine amidotransferase [Saccharicrinis fermentans DSM 9555 = JCM 21142]